MDTLIRSNWDSVICSIIIMREWLGFDEASILDWIVANNIMSDIEFSQLESGIHDLPEVAELMSIIAPTR